MISWGLQNILFSDDIAAYFGVKVALYFAWLGHYTCALGVPAVFGTILYFILWGKGQTAQDMGHVLFSLFNVAWASLYLEAWKRYSVELAFRWGTLSTPPELLEPPRPLYKVWEQKLLTICLINRISRIGGLGSFGGEQCDGSLGAQGGACLAATGVSLSGQLSHYRMLPVRGLCRDVPHVAFSGELAYIYQCFFMTQ